MHVGDLYRPRVAPFMDVENGGSGVEFPATLAKGVAGISNVDSVIPGHGPVMTFDDMKAHRDFMQDFVDQVRAGVKAGKSASQIVAAYQIPAKFKGYHEALQADRSRIKEDLEIVYNELTKK
jgi:hypothetical protein